MNRLLTLCCCQLRISGNPEPTNTPQTSILIHKGRLVFLMASETTKLRWRMIFGSLSIFFGLVFLLTFVLHALLVARFLIKGLESPPSTVPGMVLAGDVLGVGSATCVIIAGLRIFKSHWSSGIIFLGIAAVLLFICVLLGGGL